MSSLAEIAQRYALEPVHNYSPHYEELLFWHIYYSNLKASARNEAIEECVRMVEDCFDKEIARAIRARLVDALKTCRELRQYDRNAIVEECARVAEGWHKSTGHAWDIAAAIRALKDKP